MSGGLHILQMATVRWYNACADYAVQVSRGLADRGHRVVMAGFRDSPVLDRARAAGLPVLDAFDFRPGRLQAIGQIGSFRRYISESRFDVVNAHRSEDHLFAALALAQGPRIPLVRTRGDVRKPRTNWLNRLLYERYTDAHILSASFMRQRFYGDFHLGSDRLITIPPGIDGDHFRRGAPDRMSARDSLGLPRLGRVIGLIGRLTAVKGHLVALQAFKEIRKKYPDARFVISGEPYDVTEALLRERAHHLDLGDSILFLPRQDDVRRIMAALDIGIVASTGSEAICRVALEYLAMGVPVVGTDVNSIPEIVPQGIAGLIVPPNDAGALAQAAIRLLSNPVLLEHYSDAGPLHLNRNYSRARMIETTEAVYRLLIRVRR